MVTGVSGFVGAAVARKLIMAGHKVRVMVRENADRQNLQGLDVEVVIGDLIDHASLERAVSDCDYLFHVAADYRLWVPNPQHMFSVNVDGTEALMLAEVSM